MFPNTSVSHSTSRYKSGILKLIEDMLSIVIPTLNEEVFLPRLISSIKKQTFTDYEIVIADAGSTDSTRDFAISQGCRVVDGGMPAEGRNNGAAAARGDLLLFLDADVQLKDPQFLERIVGGFIERGLDIATCSVEPLSEKMIDFVLCNIYNSYLFATQKVFPHAHGFCILSSRVMHDKIKGFDETLQLAEDHDYAQRARRREAKYGLISGVKIPMSTRRFHRDGYFSIAVRYILCELHMLTIGSVKTDIFKYRFGYSKKMEKECVEEEV